MKKRRDWIIKFFQFSAFIFFVKPKLLAVNLGNIRLLHGLDVPFLGSS